MIRVGLGGPDHSSIAFFKKWPRGFYISPLVDNFDFDLQRFFIERLSASSSPEALQEVRDWAQGRLDDSSDAEVYQIVQYFVQRVRNYTHLSSLNKAKIKYAGVPETCDACSQIDGGTRHISVVRSMERLRQFRQMSHHHYLEKIWAKDHGFPPFSLECTCLMEGII